MLCCKWPVLCNIIRELCSIQTATTPHMLSSSTGGNSFHNSFLLCFPHYNQPELGRSWFLMFNVRWEWASLKCRNIYTEHILMLVRCTTGVKHTLRSANISIFSIMCCRIAQLAVKKCNAFILSCILCYFFVENEIIKIVYISLVYL